MIDITIKIKLSFKLLIDLFTFWK